MTFLCASAKNRFRKSVPGIFRFRSGTVYANPFFARLKIVRFNDTAAYLSAPRNEKCQACLPRFGLHIIRPRLDAGHVAMCVLRVGRGHVRMAHLRTRVRMVRVMGGYVLDRRKGRLQLVVPDHLLSPVLPWRHLRNRLLRAVTLDRSLDLLLISGNEAKCPGVP